MSTPYFFIEKEDISDNNIFIVGRNYEHLVKVLRAKIGDNVEVSDNTSARYITTILDISSEKAILSIRKEIKISKAYPQISLFLCILKKEAFELALQKAVEIGVDEIIPVISKRVVVNLADNIKEKRITRWQNISDNAAMQCKRDFKCAILKTVEINKIKPLSFDIFFVPVEKKLKLKKCISIENLNYYLNRKEKESKIQTGVGLKKIAYLIGPEGGFENDEVYVLLENGAVGVNFGKNILRSETASIYFLSILDYLIKKLKKC